MSGRTLRWDEPDRELDEIVRNVIGAAIEVHEALGPGFAEVVYESALAIELGLRGVTFERQVPVRVEYKGHEVGEGRIDVLAEGRLVIELKAVETLLPLHVAQVVSYLRATHQRLGLLMTFNTRRLRDGLRRVILSP